MKLSRSAPEFAVGIDMTPMIDVVFQLIIFFMLITDLTQRDLTELELPEARAAVADRPDPRVARPIVNVPQDGRIIIHNEVQYDPARDGEDTTRVERTLADLAQLMPHRRDERTGRDLPDNPLLIRADEHTEFRRIQRVLELCAKKGIQIWKIELASAQERPEERAARMRSGE